MSAAVAATEPLSRRERSALTRSRLLDATIESLIDVGYARSSMREICERANISRGAQLYHFPTKARLMAAAVEHLAHKQGAAIIEAAGKPPTGKARASWMVDRMWAGFSGPLAKASMELWTASSTDPELRESLLPVDRALARSTLEMCMGLAGSDVRRETVETLFWLTVNLTRGLALDEMLGGDPRRRNRLLGEWKKIAEESI